jgi:hypothetical protein
MLFREKETKLYTRTGKGNNIIHNKGKRKQHYTQEREKETTLYTRKGKENNIIHKKEKVICSQYLQRSFQVFHQIGIKTYD